MQGLNMAGGGRGVMTRGTEPGRARAHQSVVISRPSPPGAPAPQRPAHTPGTHSGRCNLDISCL